MKKETIENVNFNFWSDTYNCLTVIKPKYYPPFKFSIPSVYLHGARGGKPAKSF